MTQIVKEVNEEIQSHIATPFGWKVSESIEVPVAGAQELDNAVTAKKMINQQFPLIALTVESFIDKILDKFNIAVREAFISIDTDATFHIMLLVNQADYFSPELLAAKLKAKDLVANISNVTARLKFVIASEYFKCYNTQHPDMPKYSLKIA